MGVPIVTVDGGGHAQDAGYRIDKDAYALAEIDLTPAELGVLSLAAQFWQDSALQVDTSRAVTKLRAVPGGGEGTDSVAGLAPRVRAGAGAYEPLLDAIVARRVVTFTYRAASTGEVRVRRVEPWKVAVRAGGWYLLGHDQDRDAPRAFRLNRIEGLVRARGDEGAYEVPTTIDVDALVGRRAPELDEVALLALLPERASALRAHGVPAVSGVAVAGREMVAVAYSSFEVMADDIAGYGDAVVVVEPGALRVAVLDRLRRAASLRGSGGHGADGTGVTGAGAVEGSERVEGDHRG
ncbi:helix-turn-helix transcriptional regulator [Sanguibacter antarcticus]